MNGSKSIITDLSGLQKNYTLCSINIKPSRKWVRVLNDTDNNPIDIYKLKVERSLRSGDKWILCLYNALSEERYVFYLDFELCKVRFYKS